MIDARVQYVEVRRRFAAPPKRVFDAFIEPRVARHLMFAAATGSTIEAEIGARANGESLFTERQRQIGECIGIDRPRRLRFTFGALQVDLRSSAVDIAIAGDGEGCELRLVNDDVPAAPVERIREGWDSDLVGLLPAYDCAHASGPG